MQELFSELGDLKKYVIHYDRSGRSKVQIQSYTSLHAFVFFFCFLCDSLTFVYPFQGTAEVVFARRGDAVAAVKKYNNVQLDGKPMKIEILGTNTPTAAAALPANNGGYVRNVAKRYVRIATLSFICLYAKVLHDCSSLLWCILIVRADAKILLSIFYNLISVLHKITLAWFFISFHHLQKILAH